MALSMEEQRILAEIERQLAGEDPGLAVRLSRFGRPGLAAGLNTPRGRVLASFLVVGVVALLSLMVYSLMPLRMAPDGGAGSRPTAAPTQPAQAARASAPARPRRRQQGGGQDRNGRPNRQAGDAPDGGPHTDRKAPAAAGCPAEHGRRAWLGRQASRHSCSRYCSSPSSCLRARWKSSPSGSKSRSKSSSYSRTTSARLRA